MNRKFTTYPITSSYDPQARGEFEIQYYDDNSISDVQWTIAHGSKELAKKISQLVDEGYCISKVIRQR